MFSIRLKELRTKHNMSQKELAEILKVSTGTVGNWEVGAREPDFKILLKIADLFNVSVDYLLGRYNTYNHEHENQLLHLYRYIGDKFGSEAQYSLLTIAKLFAEHGKR